MQLYQSLGCAACHNRPQLAPKLTGLYGSKVQLDDGQTVIADDAYLRESILIANAKVVAGYSKLMPSYEPYLDQSQVEELLAYLRSIGSDPSGELMTAVAPPTTQPAMLKPSIDPVCKMAVVTSDVSPHVEYHGKTYYFCSEKCRDSFVKDSSKYLP